MPAGAHEQLLARLGVDAALVPPLAGYLDIVARWAPRVNLTGAATPDERVQQLVAPVLPALAHVCGHHLLDVGSGNGSPGIVMRLLRPIRRTTLLEPRARRWAFLREVVRSLGLDGVEVQRERHDDYAGPAATTVTLRWVGLSLAEIDRLLAPGGRVLVWRTGLRSDERQWDTMGRWPGGMALRRPGDQFHVKQVEGERP